jgi:hypothetical protein
VVPQAWKALVKADLTQSFRVHPAGVPAEAEEHEDHESAHQPDVPGVGNPAIRRQWFDHFPSLWVMNESPVERRVRRKGLLANDIYLQRDGDHEPDKADREKADEA